MRIGWLTILPSSGVSGTTTINIVPDENTSESARTMTIKVSTGINGIYENVNIIQNGTVESYVLNYTSAEQITLSNIHYWHNNDGTSNIVEHTFSNGSGTVVFDKSITYFPEYAFENNSGLTSVSIPRSVTGCASDDVYHINIFSHCPNLTTLKYAGTKDEFMRVFGVYPNKWFDGNNISSVECKDGTLDLINGPETKIIYYSPSRLQVQFDDFVPKITAHTFNNGIGELKSNYPILQIGYNAFRGKSSMTGIILPDYIESIRSFAFMRCYGLSAITLPDRILTDIENDAFYSCSGLTSIVIPDCVAIVGSSVFRKCSSLTTAELPKNSSIGDLAFSNTNLSAVTIPEGCILNIYSGDDDEGIFKNCTNLQTVTFDVNALDEDLPSGIFGGCSALKTVTLSPNLTGITKTNTFASCNSLQSINLENVKSISGTPFSNKPLVNIDLSNIEYVEQYAFDGCSAMTSVIIGNDSQTVNVSLGEYAFYDCTSLENVSLASSVNKINGHCFENTNSLNSIYVNCFIMSTAFLRSGVKNVHLGPNFRCSSPDAMCFADCPQLLSGKAENNRGARQFKYNDSITALTLSTGVTQLDSYAITYCASLSNVSYTGTMAQWNAVTKGANWTYNCPLFTVVHCTDGDVPIS